MYSLVYLYMLLIFDGFNETDYALFNIIMSLLSFVCLMVIMPIFSGKFQGNISNKISFNATPCIRHQCRKTAVLSCHRFLINSGVEKMNNI